MADHNRYSVDARAAGRTVLVRGALPRSTVSCSNWASMSRSPRFRSKSQMAAIQTQAKELGAICTGRYRLGYLRNLTEKARAGAFSLGPMLMALIRANLPKGSQKMRA